MSLAKLINMHRVSTDRNYYYHHKHDNRSTRDNNNTANEILMEIYFNNLSTDLMRSLHLISIPS